VPCLKAFADAYDTHFKLKDNERATSMVLRKVYNGVILLMKNSEFTLIDTMTNLNHSNRRLPAGVHYDILKLSFDSVDEDDRVEKILVDVGTQTDSSSETAAERSEAVAPAAKRARVEGDNGAPVVINVIRKLVSEGYMSAEQGQSAEDAALTGAFGGI
jgi:hypothetical protein